MRLWKKEVFICYSSNFNCSMAYFFPQVFRTFVPISSRSQERLRTEGHFKERF